MIDIYLQTKIVGNANLSCLSTKDALSLLNVWLMKNEKKKSIIFCNSYSVSLAETNKKFSEAINNGDIIFPDGFPVSLMMRLSGYKEAKRIAGPDFISDLCNYFFYKKISIFLLGSTEAVLLKLKQNLKSSYKNINICGFYSPPFKELDKKEIKKINLLINSKRPDFVFVGMGCPKQEIWMAKNKSKINSILIGFGAAFDFHANEKKRAPIILRKYGFEWLYRFIQEPKRLWSRYTVANFIFLYSIVKRLIISLVKKI